MSSTFLTTLSFYQIGYGAAFLMGPALHRFFNPLTLKATLCSNNHIMLSPRGDLHLDIKRIEHINLDRLQEICLKADWKIRIHGNYNYLHIHGLPPCEKHFRDMSQQADVRSRITYSNALSFHDKIKEVNWYECKFEGFPKKSNESQ